MDTSTPQERWLANLASTNNDFLSKAYALSNPSEARAHYDKWAASYDKDLSDLNYAFPAHAASALVSALKKSGQDISTAHILDAGCGTGLVGAILASAHGAKRIDGVDISPGMLKIAEKTGAYSKLEEADLTRPLAMKAGSYDAVICVGTLTEGHVGPSVLDEFVLIVRKGGIVDATIMEKIWESGWIQGEG